MIQLREFVVWGHERPTQSYRVLCFCTLSYYAQMQQKVNEEDRRKTVSKSTNSEPAAADGGVISSKEELSGD